MKANILTLLSAATLLLFGNCDSNKGKNDGEAITINLKEMKKIGTVSDRFQSYNVEMVEVVGGRFWKPYKMMDHLPSAEASTNYDISENNDEMYRQLSPIDLSDKRLLNLAKGLAPAYVRVSGTWANAIYFQDNDAQKAAAPSGFVNVLTRKQWKGVVDFIKATNSQLVTSFAVSNGVRDAQGVWTPIEAQKIINYTRSLGGEIAAAELFNEPTMPTAGGEISKNYDAHNYAKDVAAFNKWAKKEAPNMKTHGPGPIGEGLPGVSLADTGMKILTAEDMLSAEPKPTYDIFSYHFYGAASMRMMQSGPFSIKAENALSDSWLHRTDTAFEYNKGLRDKYLPGKPIWLTETAEAAAGGDPFSATYLDCFRYLYQLGSLAQKGVQAIMHNTLASSEYGLIDQDTHMPKPNYWAALLWARLMGTDVYDAGQGKEGVHLFAHNTKGKSGSMTLLVINNNKKSTTVNIPTDAEQYLLTSDKIEGTKVKLNGQELNLTSNDELPTISGKKVKAGNLEIPATSIMFVTFENTGK